MADEPKPNFLKVVDAKTATYPISELLPSRLHEIAVLELAALNKRLAKRKTTTLDFYEQAVFDYLLAYNRPNSTIEDKRAANKILQQTLVDAGASITYGKQAGRSSARKGEYRNTRY